jgi:hypothetical protein
MKDFEFLPREGEPCTVSNAADNLIWSPDLPAQRVDLSPIAEDPGGDPDRVPEDEQAKPAPHHDRG